MARYKTRRKKLSPRQVDTWYKDRQMDMYRPRVIKQRALPLPPSTVQRKLDPRRDPFASARRSLGFKPTSAQLAKQAARRSQYRNALLNAPALDQLRARACARRKQRREVIFAKRLTGKGAGSPRRVHSALKC